MTPPPPPPTPDETTRRISEGLQALAGGLHEVLHTIAGEEMAFCLVVFTGQRLQYVSNANREEVAEAMQSLLDGWNAGLPDVPAHELQ